jgi:radical SAM superfamily enzyme YgiQ (UPF0313 family)
MPSLTVIDTVARSEDKFPLGCEIVLNLAREAGWEADKTITDLRAKNKPIKLKRSYDMIGFSLYYPLQYLNVVPILRSIGIPPLWADRGKGYPIICAGGASVTMNPFPVADFFDFILLGDAEDVFPDILKIRKGLSKDAFLQQLSRDFSGVVVPRYPQEHYDVAYTNDISTGLLPPAEGRQPKVELARGCPFNCSFCLQGLIPYRENKLSDIKKVLVDYSGRRVLLGSNVPCAYGDIAWVLSFCQERKVYPYGFSFRLSSLSEGILRKMNEMKMVQANVGIEGYSERLRRMLRKGYRANGVIHQVNLIARYIPIITLNFISHLPTVNLADVMQFKEMMEAILEQRDREGLNTGYDLTVTPLVPRPHTEMELVPYKEERAETIAHEARMSLIEKYGGIGAKFGCSSSRRKMEFLLTRGDDSFSELLLALHGKYPTFYFHQSFNRKLFDYFSKNLDVSYWLSEKVVPHWRCISFPSSGGEGVGWR